MNEILQRVVEILERIDERLENIESKLVSSFEDISTPSSIDLLTSISKAKRQTYLAVQKLGESTCTEVAEETGRSHNLESRYLRELYEKHLLKRKRVPVADDDEEWRGTEVKYYIGEDE